MMTVGSLFSGIGGIDLGLERTKRFRTLWFCERDPYCQRVLAKHWPEVPLYSDVNDINASVPRPDVLVGGFPCQPVSYAGKRMAQEDERWLWPHVERCIRIFRPEGVLLENVTGLLTAGFDDVISGLAACGYDAEWDCIPAAAVGAPHRRDRVFIVAAPRVVADAPGESGDGRDDHAGVGSQSAARAQPRDGGGPALVADADGAAGGSSRGAGQPVHGSGAVKRSGRRSRLQSDSGWPSPMAYAHGAGLQGRGAEYELSVSRGEGEAGGRGVWAAEPNVGRVANGVPHRVDRLRALGNAVVPQVAEYVAWRLVDLMEEA